MKNPSRHSSILFMAFLVAGLVFLGACQSIFRPAPTPIPSLTPTVSLIPSITPTPTSTDTPYPTWTRVPSLTPTSTPTLTPTATQTATPSWCSSSGLVHTPIPSAVQAGGLKIVFLSSGDLWLLEEGKPASRLTNDGDIESVELSSDGLLAAYLRPASPAGSEIWLADLASGETRQILNQARLRVLVSDPEALGVIPYHLAWVPGHSRLAFNAKPVWPEVRDYTPDDLWLLELPSAQLHNLLPGGRGGEFTFSPDGLKVAVARPERLDLYGSSGEQPRINALPGYHGVGLGTEDYYPKPFWAGDSRSMRLALPSPDTAQNPNPEVDLWELPALGVRARNLGTVRALPPTVVFSPDLQRVAYINWPDLTPRIKELGLADRTGTELISGIYQPGLDLEFLAWSPDSEHFAFWLPSVLQLRLGSLCAPPEVYPAGPARLGAFSWVDSTTFIFSGGEGDTVHLFLGTVEGTRTDIGPLEGTLDFDFVLIRLSN